MVEQDDLAALDALAHGSEDALRTLFRRHSRAVYWYAVAIVSDRADAEDVVQSTFMTLWDKRTGFSAYVGSALPWLLVTAKNHSRNVLRTRRRRDSAFERDIDARPDAVGADPEQLALRADLHDEIRDALDSLEPLEREIFRLCVEEGLPYKQAAMRLGLSHGAVRNRLSRLRRSLQIKLLTTRGGTRD